MSIIKNFGKRLQEIRIANKLTQAQLAEKVGVETATISKIETGYQFPKPENIEKLAKILDTEVKDFFELDNKKTKDELAKSLCKIINNSDLADLQFYNRMITSHLEYTNRNKIRLGRLKDE